MTSLEVKGSLTRHTAPSQAAAEALGAQTASEASAGGNPNAMPAVPASRRRDRCERGNSEDIRPFIDGGGDVRISLLGPSTRHAQWVMASVWVMLLLLLLLFALTGLR